MLRDPGTLHPPNADPHRDQYGHRLLGDPPGPTLRLARIGLSLLDCVPATDALRPRPPLLRRLDRPPPRPRAHALKDPAKISGQEVVVINTPPRSTMNAPRWGKKPQMATKIVIQKRFRGIMYIYF